MNYLNLKVHLQNHDLIFILHLQADPRKVKQPKGLLQIEWGSYCYLERESHPSSNQIITLQKWHSLTSFSYMFWATMTEKSLTLVQFFMYTNA